MKPGRCHCGKPAKGRLCGECNLYFTLWKQICVKFGWKQSDRDARMAWHARAGVPEKSHTDFAHGMFTTLFNWSRQALADQSDLDSAIYHLPENEQRRNLALSIGHKAIEACFWKSGYTDLQEIKYLDAEPMSLIEAEAETAICDMAHDKYPSLLEPDGRDWRELSFANLKKLQLTVESWKRTLDPTRDTVYVRIQNGPAVDENGRIKGMSLAAKKEKPLPAIPNDGIPI